MSYTVNEPEADELISVSQGVLKTNNQILSAAIAKDHVALTNADGAERGKHTALRLKEQAVIPTTLINEGGLYVSQTDHSLYFRPYNDGTPIKIGSAQGGGAVVAWGYVSGGTVIPTGIIASSNIASFNDNAPGGEGEYYAVFTTPMASTNYAVVTTFSMKDPSGSQAPVIGLEHYSKAVDRFFLRSFRPGAPASQIRFDYASFIVVA